MKIYLLWIDSSSDSFHPSLKKAKQAGDFYGGEYEVIEYDIGTKITKDLICKLASGSNFAISSKTVYWKEP